MTDLSPIVPSDCDFIIVKTRFLNTDEFTGTEYKFIFMKKLSLLGVKIGRIKMFESVIRINLFTPVGVGGVGEKPSIDMFKTFVKDWKVECEGKDWAVMDYVYTKLDGVRL